MMEVGPGWYGVGYDKKTKKCGKTKQNPTTKQTVSLGGKDQAFLVKGS